jgi:hypothetical protein
MRVLQRTLATRPHDTLHSLLISDEAFRDTARADQAYAEAWALCYFLIRQEREGFATYVRQLGEKQPLGQDSAEERLRAFETAFGKSWQAVNAELLRAIPEWR